MQKHVAFILFVVFASALVVSSFFDFKIWLIALAICSIGYCIAFFFKRKTISTVLLFSIPFFTGGTLGSIYQHSTSTIQEKMPWYCAIDFTGIVNDISSPVFSQDTVINISLSHIISPQIKDLPSEYSLSMWVAAKEGLQIGDVMTGRAVLTPLSAPKNSQAVDFVSPALRKKVIGNLTLGHHHFTGENVTSGASLRYRIREYIKEKMTDCSASPLSVGLTQTLILGDKTAIDTSTKEAFRLSGTMHLLVVSGLHVGIIAMIVWWLTFFLRKKKILRTALVLTVLWSYGYLCGYSAPVVRALWMFSILCISCDGERSYFSLNALGVAGISYLIFHPMDVFSPGWQMSYTATAGIIIFYPKMDKWCRKLPVLLSFLVKIIAVSTVAQIALMPFVMYYFDYLNLLFPISNLLLIPLITYVVMPMGIIMIFTSLADIHITFLTSIYGKICAFATEIASTIGEKNEYAVQGFSLSIFSCVALGLFAWAVLFLVRNRKTSLYLSLLGIITILCSLLVPQEKAYLGVVEDKCVVYIGEEKFVTVPKNSCVKAGKSIFCYANDIRHRYPSESFILVTDTFFYPEVLPTSIVLLPSTPIKALPKWIKFCTENKLPMYDMRRYGYLKL